MTQMSVMQLSVYFKRCDAK